MASVELRHITKTFAGEVVAVDDVSLSIEEREFVVIVGPSGCGKSTLLRMVAGLESISAGDLHIDGRKVNEVPPKDRDIAMVFQNYALYPHMTVYGNMAFGLKLKKIPKVEVRKQVEKAAAIVGMTDYLERKPKALSGGQRQRVALGRAIVRNPKVFLFDEPLSNLDAKLRVQMRIEIARLQRQLGVTTIYVTHDQTEAMTMADRIAVLNEGRLQQFDEPMQLYNRPANRFVADFIGSPSMNFIEGRIHADGTFTDKQGLLSWRLSGLPSGVEAGDWTLGIRPEHLRAGPANGRPGMLSIPAGIRVIEPLGNESFVYAFAGEIDLILRTGEEVRLEPGGKGELLAEADKLYYFEKESGRAVYG